MNKKGAIVGFLFLMFILFSVIVYSQEVTSDVKTEVVKEFGEISETEAISTLRIAERDLNELKDKGYGVKYVTDLYLEAKRYFDGMPESEFKLKLEELNQSGQGLQIKGLKLLYEDSIKKYGKYDFNYDKVVDVASKIKQRKEKTFILDDQLKLVEKTLSEQKELYSYDFSSADEMLIDAKKAFFEERFDDVELLIPLIGKEIENIRYESSSLKILADNARKNFFSYIADNWYWLIPLIIVLIVLLFFGYNRYEVYKLERKLDDFEIETKTIKMLEKKIQTDYFKEKKISRDSYRNAMNKYKERMIQIEEETPVVMDQLKARRSLLRKYEEKLSVVKNNSKSKKVEVSGKITKTKIKKK